MKRVATAIVCLVLAAAQGSVAATELQGQVVGRTDLTYYDLLKLMVTELPPPAGTGDPVAVTIAPYRHIEGKAAKTEPAGPVAVKYFSPLEVRADGARRLLILADLGDSDMSAAEFALLGLFDVAAGKPKVVDLVEVGTDRLTGFADEPLRPLGPGADLIIVRSEHFDAGMDYVNTEVVFVRNGRFALAAATPTFSYSTCIYQFDEVPLIETRLGRPYNSVQFAVGETLRLRDWRAACDPGKIPRPFTRTVGATYCWDAHRRAFGTASTELKELTKLNIRLNTSSGVAPWER
jgi:hypothetical protein